MATVRVLASDPDLGAELKGRRRDAAERECLAKTITLPRGPWSGNRAAGVEPSGFGLLVLTGTLCRRVGQSEHHGAELLGAGDLLRPWDQVGDWASIPTDSDWVIIERARLAVLGRDFTRRSARYPEIATALISRALLRSRYLAIAIAIVSQRRVETRLQMLFWHLADRFGRIDGDSVAIKMRLTHAVLGELIGARRPSVTSALSNLRDRGVLDRDGDEWRLRGHVPGDFEQLPSGPRH
jgi:CRP/FNR family transcriptional regulator, cyclic AMP receptor protein